MHQSTFNKFTYVIKLLTINILIFMNSHIEAANTVVTVNKKGRTITIPNEIMQQFHKFAAEDKKELYLDIGAAYGVATIPLIKDNINVIANDINLNHLLEIHRSCPKTNKGKLLLSAGHFPSDISLPNSSLKGILASQVLHFLTGHEIEHAVNKMYRWLKPGGKVFTISGTAYSNNIQNVIPVYENANHPTIDELPDFFHVLDPEVLRKAFEKTGFIVEKCEFFKRSNLPQYIKFDGRENAILIAQKPY